MVELVPWAQAVSVVIVSIVAGMIGALISRRSWWFVVYIASLIFLTALVVARLQPVVILTPPFSWFLHGRSQHVIFAAVVSFTIILRSSRSEETMSQLAFFGLVSATVLYEAAVPFVLPIYLHDQLAALQTSIDDQGVCHQTTSYTCGPAAAVTALRHMGLTADEGELAVAMHTSPLVGTPPDVLADSLEDHYANLKLCAEYRKFDGIDALAGHEPVLAVTKIEAIEDHYVVVLNVTPAGVLIADPAQGKVYVSRSDFEHNWRNVGVTIWFGR